MDKVLATEPVLRYLALAGPTAAGKTAAALAIARAIEVEIISVDSALVYRGMDIGTAKPSAAELAAVPHHLIDIRDPGDPYSAAEFAADARHLMAQITARGKLPLLVGGTMLYFKVLFEGIDALPKADAGVRAAIAAEAAKKGWPALHAELVKIDPATGARLHPGDSQRIARALEVFRLSGQPLSSFHTRPAAAHQAKPELDHHCDERNDVAVHQVQGDEPPRDPSLRGAQRRGNRNSDQKSTDECWLISLEPHDRSWLHQRIAERFDAMLASGFLDEVKALRARADLHADLPAMRCVGYRQAWQYLDAQETGEPAGAVAIRELRDKAIAATRQLAKRQLTWLRSMPARRVVVCDAPAAVQEVLKLALAFAHPRIFNSMQP